MSSPYVGVPYITVAFFLDADTPMKILPIGDPGQFPGRYSLRLGSTSPEVTVSTDNEALARLRDVIDAHLAAGES